MRCLGLVFVVAGLLLVSPAVMGEDERVYMGVRVCSRCHHDGARRDQLTPWIRSKHARAHAVLALPESREIARLSGTPGDPVSNPICLGCHATAADTEAWQRDETFRGEDGVQCELCHGPGSEHVDRASRGVEFVSEDPGLRRPTKRLCMVCHAPKGSHETVIGPRPFDFESAWAAIAHPGRGGPLPSLASPDPAAAAAPHIERAPPTVEHRRMTDTELEPAGVRYMTPFNLAVSADGGLLYVVCEAADSLVVVDTGRRRIVAEVTVGDLPHGVCLSPDGRRAYVSNRGSDSVSVVDTRSLEVVATFAVGDEPHGLTTNDSGEILYVANAGSGDISVVDVSAGGGIKRLAAGRGAWGVCRSPVEKSVFVTNNLSHFVPFRASSRSEVTVVGTGRSTVTDRIMIDDANLVQGVDVAPDGRYTLVTLLRTKNLVPMTRVIQGWMITNGLGILWSDGRVDQLLLDEPDSGFADPTDVVITPDGRLAFVSGGGVDQVAVVDLRRLQALLEGATDEERRDVLPNHFGVPTQFVVARIPVGRNPRGLAVSPDGRRVYVADALDDAVSVIDVASRRRVAVIPLGGPTEVTLAREGERIFHSASITYGAQFSCHSCHPDGGVDGITYDIEADGIGVNPVDNRTLRGILDTAPFKWTGKNPTLSRQCGPRLAVFFTRIDPFSTEQVRALERYICTIPRNPNRHRTSERLTPAQRRGKLLFERRTDNAGDPIPEDQRCSTCHPPPYYTNREQVSVGTASELDTHDVFDVPHLSNIYETAPYLHDGRADTLEEIWTRYNPDDRHGVTNDMTKDQLNDLIEYLKVL
jgi:YVTN family beta-propeller protein